MATEVEQALIDTIISMAGTPRRVTTDEGTVVERSLKELMEVLPSLEETTSDPLRGLRMSRCKPAGPV